ncbi:MAG: Mur ligase family protein, partial [Patescibacteria group bacterium]
SSRASVPRGSGQESNFIAGGSEYFVVEACEYKRSFLNIVPKIIVITNIDNDHLDYYKDIEDIQSAFREFVQKLPANGIVICNPRDPLLHPVLDHTKAKIIDYTSYPKVTLSVPGTHNILNAQAAQAVADIIGVDENKSFLALSKFKGTWRRFEYKGHMKNGALVYDDYAHHPTEIAATIAAARESFPSKEITVVFQPHLYSRTKLLLDDFAQALSVAEHIIVLDIYAARELNDYSISAEHLVKKISDFNKNVLYIPVFKDIVSTLSKSKGEKDVIVTLGAGDIYKVSENLITL